MSHTPGHIVLSDETKTKLCQEAQKRVAELDALRERMRERHAQAFAAMRSATATLLSMEADYAAAVEVRDACQAALTHEEAEVPAGPPFEPPVSEPEAPVEETPAEDAPSEEEPAEHPAETEEPADEPTPEPADA